MKLTKKDHQKIKKDVNKQLHGPQSRPRQILQEIFETTDVLGSVYYYPGKTFGEIRRIKEGRAYRDAYQREKTALIRLKKQGLVEARKNGDRMILLLTEKGRAVALKNELRNTDKYLPEGALCLVVFDIPENARYARDALRHFLKQCGFSMVQLSVWKSDKDVSRELKKFVDEMHVTKWVSIFEGMEIK